MRRESQREVVISHEEDDARIAESRKVEAENDYNQICEDKHRVENEIALIESRIETGKADIDKLNCEINSKNSELKILNSKISAAHIEFGDVKKDIEKSKLDLKSALESNEESKEIAKSDLNAFLVTCTSEKDAEQKKLDTLKKISKTETQLYLKYNPGLIL